MRKDIQGLKVGDAKRIGKRDVHIESDGFEYSLFDVEQENAAGLICAFRDVVLLCLGVRPLVRRQRRRVKGGEVGVYVHDGSWGFRVRRELGGEVNGSG